MILRNFQRFLLRKRNPIKSQPVDYAVCIDIECTCDSPLQIDPMEVIEIACINVPVSEIARNSCKSTSRSIFHSYVKPEINPTLTVFCQDLTGIFQSDVDKAPPISIVTGNLLDWLKSEKLIDEHYKSRQNFAFASCGNFDLTLLSPIIRDCHFADDIKLPIYFEEWINVKKTFVNHKKEWPKQLYHMMDLLELEPSGRLHSALDDCKNLAQVVECLSSDGCSLVATSKLPKTID